MTESLTLTGMVEHSLRKTSFTYIVDPVERENRMEPSATLFDMLYSNRKTITKSKDNVENEGEHGNADTI